MINPPAFPLPIHKTNFDTSPSDFRELDVGGMTLRDYFAAKAFQGLLASSEAGTDQEVVQAAWYLADLMLEEREKQNAS